MKRIARKLLYLFLRCFYPHFNNPRYFKRQLLFIAFMQKIVGINRKVRWPVHYTSKIVRPDKIDPGNQAPGYAPGCYIDGRNGIIFDENVWTGPHVSIISMNHDLNNFNKYIEGQPIKIGRNSLLATGCIILPGRELGERTIVGAGAVVTKSFPEGHVVLTGNPAQAKKHLSRLK